MTDSLEFTKLVVVDLERSAAFYVAVFEMTEVNRVTASIGDRTIHEIMYEPSRPGGPAFVLLSYEDRDEPAAEEVILGFISDDVDALVDRALSHGGTVVDAAHDLPEHGVRVAFVADPEGHLLELVQVLAA